MTVTVSRTEDLAACHALRRAVFIDEQKIPDAEEWDDLDETSIHLLARDRTLPVGTARVHRAGPLGKIGRVCVAPSHRGRGIGALLIRAGLVELRGMAGLTTARLSAQVYAIPFYQRLGFVAHGREYDDAGIPHRDMDLPL